ncbi:MAG: hypothetical protein FJW39_33405, partial [Acidobacteria bacterium]|nr:hypothetical protein [Acidobacteriota bacterium]
MTTRRTFLTVSAAAALNAQPASPAQFRARLVGAICSVPTVYKEDRSLDLESFKRIVDTGVSAGCSAFTLTSGNNQYDRLSYEEIKQLTRALVEAVAGRGLTIAATGPWWTGQVVNYAKYARELGADAVQVQLPAQGDQASQLEHFREAARAAQRAIVLHGQVPIPLL